MTYIKSFKQFNEGYFSRIAGDIEDGLNVNKIAKKYGVDLKLVKKWAAEWKKEKAQLAMGEEAPMNATGAAVSTDKPIVRKKKQYEIWKRAALEK
jgi:transposase